MSNIKAQRLEIERNIARLRDTLKKQEQKLTDLQTNCSHNSPLFRVSSYWVCHDCYKHFPFTGEQP